MKKHACIKSFADNLVTACDEILDTSETASINSFQTEVAYKTDYFITSTILLVTMCLFLLLIMVAINCYYHRKQACTTEYLVPY